MEQTVQLIGRQQMLQTMEGGQQALGLMAGGDAFAQVFLNMMQGMQNGEDVDPSNVLVQGMQQTAADTEDKERDAAMELMAMLLQAPTSMQDLVRLIPQETLEQMQVQGVSAEQVQQLVSGLMQTVPTEQVQTVEQVMPELVQMQPEQVQNDEMRIQARVLKGDAAPEVSSAQVQTAAAEALPESRVRDLFLQQSQMVQMRQAVQQGSAQQASSSEERTEDVLAQAVAMPVKQDLQTQIKLQQLKPAQVQPEQAQPPVKQVLDQMQLNFAKGTSEFTMKLNPEHLGEITVKLLERSGKMVLSITAASEQTVKLLNGDLAALREAVRPMQVEVREAVVSTQSSDGNHMAGQQQMDMSGQFFNQSQQMQQQMQREHNARNAAAQSWQQWLNSEAAEPEVAVQAAQVIAENLLDSYY